MILKRKKKSSNHICGQLLTCLGFFFFFCPKHVVRENANIYVDLYFTYGGIGYLCIPRTCHALSPENQTRFSCRRYSSLMQIYRQRGKIRIIFSFFPFLPTMRAYTRKDGHNIRREHYPCRAHASSRHRCSHRYLSPKVAARRIDQVSRKKIIKINPRFGGGKFMGLNKNVYACTTASKKVSLSVSVPLCPAPLCEYRLYISYNILQQQQQQQQQRRRACGTSTR